MRYELYPYPDVNVWYDDNHFVTMEIDYYDAVYDDKQEIIKLVAHNVIDDNCLVIEGVFNENGGISRTQVEKDPFYPLSQGIEWGNWKVLQESNV